MLSYPANQALVWNQLINVTSVQINAGRWVGQTFPVLASESQVSLPLVFRHFVPVIVLFLPMTTGDGAEESTPCCRCVVCCVLCVLGCFDNKCISPFVSSRTKLNITAGGTDSSQGRSKP